MVPSPCSAAIDTSEGGDLSSCTLMKPYKESNQVVKFGEKGKCSIGHHPWQRHASQQLLVSVAVGLETQGVSLDESEAKQSRMFSTLQARVFVSIPI